MCTFPPDFSVCHVNVRVNAAANIRSTACLAVAEQSLYSLIWKSIMCACRENLLISNGLLMLNAAHKQKETTEGDDRCCCIYSQTFVLS